MKGYSWNFRKDATFGGNFGSSSGCKIFLYICSGQFMSVTNSMEEVWTDFRTNLMRGKHGSRNNPEQFRDAPDYLLDTEFFGWNSYLWTKLRKKRDILGQVTRGTTNIEGRANFPHLNVSHSNAAEVCGHGVLLLLRCFLSALVTHEM